MQLLLFIPLIFLVLFLLLPLFSLLLKAFSLGMLEVALPILLENLTWVSFFVTFNLALVVTFGSLCLASFLTFLFVRYNFVGASYLRALLILPIIVPPFVSGIGIRKIFSRFGPLNLALIDLGILSEPIDWLGISGFVGVAIAEILHYYPIIFVSLLSSSAALDYSLVQAAQLSGAKTKQIVKDILVPLFLPSTVASLVLVFAWSFTELGTPLIFDYRSVLPVKLFTALDDLHTNPRGYVYVLLVLAVSLLAGLTARHFLKNKVGLGFSARGASPIPQEKLSTWKSYSLAALLVFLSVFLLLPQIGVFLLAISDRWNMTIYPEQVSFRHFTSLFFHPLVLNSLVLSLILAVSCCILLLLFSSLIVFVGRGESKLGRAMSLFANLSLIVPGIVIAYAYLETFRGTILDPRVNPLPILAIGYAIRRLPLMVNNLISALSVASLSLEEAARLSGATAFQTFRKITLPLAMPFIVSGMILSFVFAMFEVSESLMLAQQEKFFPVSKTIYALLTRPDGPAMACALGTLAFVVTCLGILLAARLSRRKLEDLFRIT